MGAKTRIAHAFTSSRCRDLLNGRAPVTMIDGNAVGAVELEVLNAEELLAFVEFAQRVRPTEATGVHSASSRSHSLLRIYCKPAVITASTAAASSGHTEGILTLVDLAGSERGIDSM